MQKPILIILSIIAVIGFVFSCIDYAIEVDIPQCLAGQLDCSENRLYHCNENQEWDLLQDCEEIDLSCEKYENKVAYCE